MRSFMLCLAAGLAACLASYTLGCAGRTATPASHEMPDPHSPIFVEKCTKCHGLDKVEQAHKTKTSAEMKAILKKHRKMDGTPLTDEDLKALLKLY